MGNTFENAGIKSLEMAWLPQFFEGPVVLSNVSVSSNTFIGSGNVTPVHCGPGCGLKGCLYNSGDRPTLPWTEKGCPLCPQCKNGVATPWTRDIRLENNSFR